MGLRIIYGRAGVGKTTHCINEIKKQIKNGTKNKLILIVPEQFTFQTENKILEAIGEKSVLNLEVLSFKRIAYRVFNECGGVTRKIMKDAGKSMLIYKVLEDLINDMSVFGNACKQKGFIDVVSDTITEFKKYNISGEILKETYEKIDDEELKSKLQDLNIIYDEFNERLHKEYIDGEDQLTLLDNKLTGCNIYDGAEIWVDEFSTFTPQQMNVLMKLMKKAKQVNITLTADEGNTYKGENDIFHVAKSTERRLLRAIEENNIAFKGYSNLNEDIPYRFKENKALEHIEKYLFSYPFKTFNEKTQSVRLYKANNSYDEMVFIAKDILRLVRDKGYRYKDVSVVCRNIDDYEKISSVIFDEYNIPYHIDKKMDVASNPLIILINSAIDVITKNWTYEGVFKYLKSGLTGISIDEIDILENYVLAHGIKGKKWSEETWNYYSSNSFVNEEMSEEDKEKLLIINQIKDKVREPLIKLHEISRGKKKLIELAVNLFEFLENLNVIERVEEYISYFEENKLTVEAKEYSKVLDILMEVLDQAVEVLGNEEIDLREFINILNIGFGKYKLGVIPVALDEVAVGDITRIKSKGAKALYIVGVNDGVLPASNNDEGILSDKDRGNLKDKGISLASDTRAKVFEEQFLVYTAFTIASEYLVVTYPLADFEGKSLRPSIVIHRIKKILPNVKEESESYKIDKNIDKYYNVSAKNPTFNEMVSAFRRSFEKKEIEKYWHEVYTWFYQHEDFKEKAEKIFAGLNYTNQVEKVSKEKTKELYGNDYGKLMLSVSKLERYAQCPFAYYVQYGLKARDRKIYEFTSPDIGIFMHEILDDFTEEVKSKELKWCDLTQEKCKEIINSLVKNKVDSNEGSILNSSKRYNYFTDRFKRILTKSVTIISEQMRRSNFEIFKNEFAFGNSKDSNPIKINITSGEEVFLTGRVDRIDTLDFSEQTYLRIIDYKSGNKKFDLNQLFNGLQIQLLVYLDALIENADKIIKKQAMPGAIFFLKIDDPIIKSNKNISEEEVKEEVLKQLKMDGLLLKDVNVVKCMDNELEEGYSLIIPARIKKDGELGTSNSLITLDQFQILRKYVNEKMVELCDEMISGNIKIEPCKENKNTYCDYCDYSHICQFDSGMKDNNYKIIRKKDDKEIWKEMSEKTGIKLGGENNDK